MGGERAGLGRLRCSLSDSSHGRFISASKADPVSWANIILKLILHLFIPCKSLK